MVTTAKLNSISNPFLTVITRVNGKRPRSLTQNMRSLDRQTDKDYEHILIEGVNGGLHAANKSFMEAKQKVKGKYVFLLDDDDIVVNRFMIERLKEIAAKDIVLFRCIILNGSNNNIYPSDKMWDSQQLMPGHVGTFCFATRAEVFNDYIHFFGTPTMGDYNYLRSIWHKEKQWIDEVMACTLRIGKGGKIND